MRYGWFACSCIVASFYYGFLCGAPCPVLDKYIWLYVLFTGAGIIGAFKHGYFLMKDAYENDKRSKENELTQNSYHFISPSPQLLRFCREQDYGRGRGEVL